MTVFPTIDFSLVPTFNRFLVQGQLWNNGNTFAIVGPPTSNPLPPVTLPGLPTSPINQPDQTVWNNGGVVSLIPQFQPPPDSPLLQRLLDTVQGRLPGATEALVRLELGNVTRNFLERSTAWRVAYTMQMDQAGPMVAYPVPVFGKYARVAAVISASYKGNPIAAAPRLYVPGTIIETGPPRQLQWDEPDYFVLTPGVIDAANPMTLVLALRVDQIEYMPENILSRFYDQLESGVLGTMYLQPSKPWTNVPEGNRLTRKYYNQISEARRRVEGSFVRGTVPWRFPTFAVQRSVAQVNPPLPMDFTMNASISPEGFDFSGLPLLNTGLTPGSGALWSDSGVLCVV